jgi:Uma2 family endonuclease
MAPRRGSRSLAAMATASYSSDLLTCDDLWAMPDDGRRRELIDGMLIVTPSPNRRHQRASFRLSVLLANACPPDLEMLPAPFDYKVSENTLLIPDLIVARKADYGPDRLERTPLLVVEIRSPSTGRYDEGTKRLAYEAAGVPSYWMVDPDEPRLTVLRLIDGTYQETDSVSGDDAYDATEPIPVRIVPADLVRD